MCGICGFTGTFDPELLEKMGNRIAHRGPDGSGSFNGDGIHLCSRRLRILDLETGEQPLYNEDRSLVCVWNGEIYNHQELRRDLIHRGHRFYTDHSDGEVILHLYEEYGLDFLAKVNGMFAIALWDRDQECLILARDRMGVKPLFYSTAGSDLIFASEIKSLLLHPSCSTTLNYDALYHYFSFHTLCAPDTAYRDILALLPGQILIWQAGACKCHTYWRPPFASEQNFCADHLLALIEDSVAIRMQADTPVGYFLSGGLDSSLITAIAAGQETRLFTYSLGHHCAFQSGLYHKDDDLAFAEQIADTFHTNHTTYMLDAQEFLDGLSDIIQAFDQPFSASFSTFFLSRQIAKSAPCALGGDGADELFGSYRSHRLALPFAYYAQSKQAGLFPFEMDRTRLAPFDKDLQLLERLYCETFGDEALLACQMLNTTDAFKGLYLSPEIFGEQIAQKATQRFVVKQYEELVASTPLNRMLEFQFRHLLPDQVLSYTDILSMANSLEVRSPFLDYRLVEYVCGRSDTLKIPGGESKALLKQVATRYLPDDLIHRPKEGFVQPTQDWMRLELREYLTDLLSPSSLAQDSLFLPEMVDHLLMQFFHSDAPDTPLADVIWNIACFQQWWRLRPR